MALPCLGRFDVIMSWNVFLRKKTSIVQNLSDNSLSNDICLNNA